jgi:dihydrodipicolinate synthase/N-acetylneuraminate lyase
LQDVHVAAITPLGRTGAIDFGATFDLIDSLCAARVGGIALFTISGEYPALAVDDRVRLTNLAVKRSRVPVLAGVGSGTLDHSLELAREARSAGVAAVLLPPPLYGSYDQDDVFEFYTQFAAEVGSSLAILLSGEVGLGTARKLLETGRFAGIVDGSGGVDTLNHLRAHAGSRAILAGDDRMFVHARMAGLGAVSGVACAAPELTMALSTAIGAGDEDRIARLEAMRRELMGWLDRFPPAVGVKTAVAARGIHTGPLPVPLCPAKQQSLEQFREWFLGWLPATTRKPAHA